MKSTQPARRLICLLAAGLLAAPLFVNAQQTAPTALAGGPAIAANGGKPIAIEDYGRFKRIGAASISSDGKWMLYTVTPNEGDGTLFVQSLDSERKHEIPRGTGASFSDTGRWVGYFIAPPSGRGRGAGGRAGQPPATGGQGQAPPPARTFEILDLNTGSRTTFPAVASFSFSPDGEWLLMRPQGAAAQPAADAGGRGGGRGGQAGAPADNSQPGTDLLMRNLATGDQRYVGNVGTFSFDDAGKLMAYTVRGQQRLGNGV